MTLIAEARALSREPARLIARFAEHMREHGMAVQGGEADCLISHPGGSARLRIEPGGIFLRIEAQDAERMADARNIVAGHLDAFAPGEDLGIVWQGEGAVPADARPHNFRALRVRRARTLTPRMRRLTLAGQDLARFDAAAMHVRLLIPQNPAIEPAWPRLTPSGQPDLAGCGLLARAYTIRRIDVAAGEIEIDFVLHGEESLGSRFAARAEAGHWVGMMGPGGGAPSVEGWCLLGGDETALPAIARALEAMPADARGLALIEVADAAEEQPLAHPPGIALRWLHRNGAAHGAALLAAVKALAWPAGERVAAWVAAEHATAAALREHWREHGPAQGRARAAAFWRAGAAGED